MLVFENIKHLYNRGGKVSSIVVSSKKFLESELYLQILNQTEFLPDSSAISERLYCVKENITSLKLCEVCGLNKKTFSRGIYKNTCGMSCAIKHKDTQSKIKRTKFDKYGSETYNNPNKSNETCLLKYGVARPLQNLDVKNKQNQTMLGRYGHINGFQSTKSQESMIERYGVPRFNNREKVKRTNLERYGVEYPLQSRKIIEKQEQTNLERYGVKYHFLKHITLDVFDKLNDNEWLYDQYVTMRKTSNQIAKELNIGSCSTICNYLHKSEIKIRNYAHSIVSIRWLTGIAEKENIHIRHAQNGGEYQIPSTKFKVDGFCEENNTVYEFYGDYFHGNPLAYESTYFNSVCRKSMGELYAKTIKRENKIKELGYELVTIWERDFAN